MTGRVLTALLGLVVTTAFAQDPPPQPLTQRDVRGLLEQVPTISGKEAEAAGLGNVQEPPDPPVGANAWSLRVYTTGGFTGMGVGSVTVSSDGSMACGPAPCATPAGATLLEPFVVAIAAVIEAPWNLRPPSGFCNDCVRTTLALKRREGNTIRVYRASWDDSQPPSAELRELRRLAFEIKAARSAR